MSECRHFEVAIIGAGPGGIAAAHLLRRRGITDLVILERGDDFGGTWRDNHYPGLAVDIPIFWYELSFARNPHWTRLFAPGSEIQRYLTDTASRCGLYPHLRTGAEVVQQVWDDDAGIWRLAIRGQGGQSGQSGQSEVTARFVISSVGGYVNARSCSDIEGLSDFGGTILRPDAWDDAFDTTGKKVAVIGTGSSGTQIVSALSGGVARLEVYQRTPNWILPKPDLRISPRLRTLLGLPGVTAAIHHAGRLAFDLFLLIPVVHLMSHLPDRVLVAGLRGYDALARLWFRALLRAVVDDRSTRRRLLPRHGILGKRPIISSSYLPAFNEATTALVTTPIERITPNGIRTVDGVEHDADLIVTANGYELWTDPETYRTRTILGTRGFDLAEDYRRHGLRSYAGTAHPRLPNRWEIVGPLGFVGVGWTDFVEMMAEHAARVIDEARRCGPDVVASVRPGAFEAYHARMRSAGKTAHLYFTRCNEGVNTYFVNSQGDTVYHRPQTILGARRLARRSPDRYYLLSPHRTHATAATGPATGPATTQPTEPAATPATRSR
ncbi:flavin-containing monooxygenase [Mycolicibacterium palauense]|uniref:flavin-containing monooxygenase n=1 Tax=Mycolicibacterium palauense TaxID=2034511 RepID=UPI000BFEAF15|nr:NAD(P)/FAD-dependent oxidoreductase [Mycolicibacterium palauense]